MSPEEERKWNLTSGSVVGNALQLLHNVDVQQFEGQQVLRSHREIQVRLLSHLQKKPQKN